MPSYGGAREHVVLVHAGARQHVVLAQALEHVVLAQALELVVLVQALELVVLVQALVSSWCSCMALVSSLCNMPHSEMEVVRSGPVREIEN